MSTGYDFGFLWREPSPPPTEDEIFAAWVAFGGDSLLSEFREAYLSVPR